MSLDELCVIKKTLIKGRNYWDDSYFKGEMQRCSDCNGYRLVCDLLLPDNAEKYLNTCYDINKD